MPTNSGVWSGWNNFYGSGNYTITGDTLNISTDAANMSALLYLSTIAKPGEKITIEYDARTISGVGRITASSRVAYTSYNTQLVENSADFRSYSFDVEVPTKVAGPQLVFFGVGIWRGDNTTAGAEVEFVLRNVIRQDAGGRALYHPDTFGLLQPETRLLLNRLLVEPYKDRTNLIDGVIYQLKDAGIWEKLDALYVMAEPYTALATVNWINPGQYDLKEVNSPTFTADVGYTGHVDAVTPPYLQTSFNPLALEGTDDDGNGVADEAWAAKFTMADNSMFVWADYVENIPNYIIGTRAHAISPFSETYPDRVYCRNGVESGSYVAGVSRVSGLYGMSRDNSSTFDIYVNGASAGTVTSTPTTMYSESIQILKRAANTGTTNGNPVRIAGFGSSLTAQEWAELYRIFANYMASLGGHHFIPLSEQAGLYGFLPPRLKRWRKALARARAGGAPAKILCLGDSTTLGFGSSGAGSTDCRAKSYPAFLASILTGYGITAQANSFFGGGGVGSNLPVSDPRVATTGGWSAAGATSLGGLMLATATAGTLSFTPTAPVKTFDVWYRKNTGDGTFTVDIDGAGTVSQSANDSPGVGKVTITAGSTGTHTCNVAWVSGSVQIIAIEGRADTDLVSVWNAGRSGAKIADILVAGFQWSQIQSLYTFQPDLIIINLTINDAAAATNATTYQNNMQSLISAIATVPADVILCTGIPSATGTASVAQQKIYQDIVYALSQTNNLPFYDVTKRWVSQADGLALGLYVDALHATGLGYADYANPLAVNLAMA